MSEDGFIYPPCDIREGVDTITGGSIRIAGKPASVFYLPASHVLQIKKPISEKRFRFEDGALIIHLLGFFFETRLQFYDWRFDGRVPIKQSGLFRYRGSVPRHFISLVYNKWKTWKNDARNRYINILYMYRRARSLEWEWEEFINQYLVFDAIYKLHLALGGKRAGRHKDRFVMLCDEYSIRYELDQIDSISERRNELFHEALWDGGTPGLKFSDSFQLAGWLSRLNSRLIVAIAGYQNEYSKSAWWYMGSELFDKFEVVGCSKQA